MSHHIRTIIIHSIVLFSFLVLPPEPYCNGYQTHATGFADPRKPPITFEELLKAVEAIRPREKVVQAIENRGLAFKAITLEQLNSLRETGAQENVVEAVKKRAKTEEPPPPEPPATAGPLTLICSPPECEIAINGHPEGFTQGGKREIAGLSPGLKRVDLKKEDPPHESKQIDVVLEPNVPATRTVVLVPTLSAKHIFGGQLASRMVQALGGSVALSELGSISAAGEATLWNETGVSSDWGMTASLKLPDIASLDLRGPGSWSISLAGGQTRHKGRLPRNLQWVEVAMESNLRMFRDFQPISLIKAIQATPVEYLADSLTPADGKNLDLVVNQGAVTYTIALADDLTPTLVTFQSESGIARRAFYSNYKGVAHGRYPHTITLKPDASSRAIQLRFSNVRLAPG